MSPSFWSSRAVWAFLLGFPVAMVATMIVLNRPVHNPAEATLEQWIARLPAPEKGPDLGEALNTFWQSRSGRLGRTDILAYWDLVRGGGTWQPTAEATRFSLLTAQIIDAGLNEQMALLRRGDLEGALELLEAQEHLVFPASHGARERFALAVRARRTLYVQASGILRHRPDAAQTERLAKLLATLRASDPRDVAPLFRAVMEQREAAANGIAPSTVERAAHQNFYVVSALDTLSTPSPSEILRRGSSLWTGTPAQRRRLLQAVREPHRLDFLPLPDVLPTTTAEQRRDALLAVVGACHGDLNLLGLSSEIQSVVAINPASEVHTLGRVVEAAAWARLHWQRTGAWPTSVAELAPGFAPLDGEAEGLLGVKEFHARDAGILALAAGPIRMGLLDNLSADLRTAGGNIEPLWPLCPRKDCSSDRLGQQPCPVFAVWADVGYRAKLRRWNLPSSLVEFPAWE